MNALNLTSDGKLFVEGEMTFNTVNQLWEESQPLLEHIRIIDLKEVKRSDSAGLALLIEWHQYVQRYNGSVTFKNLPVSLLNMAKVSGIHEFLQFNESSKHAES